MNVWVAKVIVLAANAVMIAIRAPHGQRSRSMEVAKSYRGPLETMLLTLVMIGFFVPLIWIIAPVFWFAEYPLMMTPLVAGTICLAIGLWIFHRSHVDLGTNWSITLEVRKEHRLVTGGVYRHIRHPMYAGLMLFSIGQALVIPNWIAGPAYLVPFTILYLLRVRAEERMMIDRFGAEYEAYIARTKRLIPFVW